MKKLFSIAFSTAFLLASVVLAQNPTQANDPPAAPAPAASPAPAPSAVPAPAASPEPAPAASPSADSGDKKSADTSDKKTAGTKKKTTGKRMTRQQEIDRSINSGTVPSRYRSQVPREYQQYIPFEK